MLKFNNLKLIMEMYHIQMQGSHRCDEAKFKAFTRAFSRGHKTKIQGSFSIQGKEKQEEPLKRQHRLEDGFKIVIIISDIKLAAKLNHISQLK